MLVEVFGMNIRCVPSRISPSKEGDTTFPSLLVSSQGLENTVSVSHRQKWISGCGKTSR